MGKENFNNEIISNDYSITACKVIPSPRHRDYRFQNDPNDLCVETVSLKPKNGDSPWYIPKFISEKRKILKTVILLPLHMQPEYGYGKSATETDCYGISLLYSDPNYVPDIGSDRDYLLDHYKQIPPSSASVGDIWEFFNPYEQIIGYNLQTGRALRNTINHCAVVQTPDLIWTKNGSGLWAGFFLSELARVKSIYQGLRDQMKVSTPYQELYWRKSKD